MDYKSTADEFVFKQALGHKKSLREFLLRFQNASKIQNTF